MTYEESVLYMESLKSVGMQMGLERTAVAVRELGHPERSFRAVHIAGTNGKGSTARMIAAMCAASGHRTGLYTSPYLTTPLEAIAVCGEPISEELFAACATKVRDTVTVGLSEYEFLTLVMFCAFEQTNVTIGVVECCLGGETDTTNILPPPLCAVFTPIALDHTAVLGNTLAAIAAQKGGIIKSPCDVVCAPSMHEDALGVLYEIAAARGVTLHQPALAAIGTPHIDRNGTRFCYDDREFTLSMTGEHQCENAVTAWTALKCLCRNDVRVDEAAAAKALSTVTLPCRQEIVYQEPFVMLDGAHNPHGIAALCRTIERLQLAPVTLVIGMLADKATKSCLSMLAPFCDRIVCTTPRGTSRAMAAEDLAAVAATIHPKVACVFDPLDAYYTAQRESDRPVIVGGSFYTAAAVRDGIKKALPTKR